MVRKFRRMEQTPGVAGKVADNPETSHPSDQLADLGGINQAENPDKSPETPKGAEKTEPRYEAMEGDDYLEAILAKLEELERRISDMEGGSEVGEMGEEVPVEDVDMAVEDESNGMGMVEDEEEDDYNNMREKLVKRKRIERKAIRLFTPKVRVERKMTKRISTVPVGHSAHNERTNLKEFLNQVSSDARRL